MEEHVDWLRESAKSFAKLKNIRYDLTIAHAGKLVEISIGQHKFTILHKEKVNIKTKEINVLKSSLKK